MLDARYLMLDIQECSDNEIKKHPVSRNQYPGSINVATGFRRNSLSAIQYIMQLFGLHYNLIAPQTGAAQSSFASRPRVASIFSAIRAGIGAARLIVKSAWVISASKVEAS
jgi:hypothetical protein